MPREGNPNPSLKTVVSTAGIARKYAQQGLKKFVTG